MCRNRIGFIAAGLLPGVATGTTHAGIIAYRPFDEGTGYYSTNGDYVYQIPDEKFIAGTTLKAQSGSLAVGLSFQRFF